MTCPCGKRAYQSTRQAREAHRRAGYRLKVYRCDRGPAYHVANPEKASATTANLTILARRRSGPKPVPGLAPVRTLDEVRAIAAEMRGRG
jgi:hypothetical protein